MGITYQVGRQADALTAISLGSQKGHQVQGEIERLCARLFRVVLEDPEDPLLKEESLILAREVPHALLGDISRADPDQMRRALNRLKGLCQDYDID